MKPNSLAFRLFATAAVWVIVVLPIAGLLVHNRYRAEVEDSFDSRIELLLVNLVAESTDHDGPEPTQPSRVPEPLFEIHHSGWYWQIGPLATGQGKLIQSPSLGGELLALPVGLADAGGSRRVRWAGRRTSDEDGFNIRWGFIDGPAQQKLRIAEIVYAMPSKSEPKAYSYAVAGTLAEPDGKIAGFLRSLMMALAASGGAFLAMTLMQIHFGLRPMRAVEKGLSAIRSGDAARLEGSFPSEIVPLQTEINALIESNQTIIERARTQVGNLAHALKTPLAVISNEARGDNSPFAEKVSEQAVVMRDQISLYLDRARMVARAGVIGGVTPVRQVVDPIARALKRIHVDRNLSISVSCADALRFQGEKHDLEEMIGNLLDNACKWCRKEVAVTVALSTTADRTSKPYLIITVEDDGPGLSGAQRDEAVKRGRRLDETKPGSGLGLSIVVDLAQLYRGSLRLKESRLGGLSAELELPAA